MFKNRNHPQKSNYLTNYSEYTVFVGKTRGSSCETSSLYAVRGSDANPCSDIIEALNIVMKYYTHAPKNSVAIQLANGDYSSFYDKIVISSRVGFIGCVLGVAILPPLLFDSRNSNSIHFENVSVACLQFAGGVHNVSFSNSSIGRVAVSLSSSDHIVLSGTNIKTLPDNASEWLRIQLNGESKLEMSLTDSVLDNSDKDLIYLEQRGDSFCDLRMTNLHRVEQMTRVYLYDKSRFVNYVYGNIASRYGSIRELYDDAELTKTSQNNSYIFPKHLKNEAIYHQIQHKNSRIFEIYIDNTYDNQSTCLFFSIKMQDQCAAVCRESNSQIKTKGALCHFQGSGSSSDLYQEKNNMVEFTGDSLSQSFIITELSDQAMKKWTKSGNTTIVMSNTDNDAISMIDTKLSGKSILEKSSDQNHMQTNLPIAVLCSLNDDSKYSCSINQSKQTGDNPLTINRFIANGNSTSTRSRNNVISFPSSNQINSIPRCHAYQLVVSEKPWVHIDGPMNAKIFGSSLSHPSISPVKASNGAIVSVNSSSVSSESSHAIITTSNSVANIDNSAIETGNQAQTNETMIIGDSNEDSSVAFINNSKLSNLSSGSVANLGGKGTGLVLNNTRANHNSSFVVNGIGKIESDPVSINPNSSNKVAPEIELISNTVALSR
jgi:hypothetical protein